MQPGTTIGIPHGPCPTINEYGGAFIDCFAQHAYATILDVDPDPSSCLVTEAEADAVVCRTPAREARAVQHRSQADGSEVAYYQLAENEWDPTRGRAVAKIIYNFGRADQLDPGALRRLAASILRVVDETTTSRTNDVEPDLQLRDAWPYGGVHVLEHLWRELGIGEVIRAHAKSKRTADSFERALFAMVANRALSSVAHVMLRAGRPCSPSGTTSIPISQLPGRKSNAVTFRPSCAPRARPTKRG